MEKQTTKQEQRCDWCGKKPDKGELYVNHDGEDLCDDCFTIVLMFER